MVFSGPVTYVDTCIARSYKVCMSCIPFSSYSYIEPPALYVYFVANIAMYNYWIYHNHVLLIVINIIVSYGTILQLPFTTQRDVIFDVNCMLHANHTTIKVISTPTAPYNIN